MQALKALFWFFVVPVAVIVGIFFGIDRLGQKKHEQGQAGRIAAAVRGHGSHQVRREQDVRQKYLHRKINADVPDLAG